MILLSILLAFSWVPVSYVHTWNKWDKQDKWTYLTFHIIIRLTSSKGELIFHKHIPQLSLCHTLSWVWSRPPCIYRQEQAAVKWPRWTSCWCETSSLTWEVAHLEANQRSSASGCSALAGHLIGCCFLCPDHMTKTVTSHSHQAWWKGSFFLSPQII